MAHKNVEWLRMLMYFLLFKKKTEERTNSFNIRRQQVTDEKQFNEKTE